MSDDKATAAVRKLGHRYTGVSSPGYCYSLNGERYDYEYEPYLTREAALAGAHEAITTDGDDVDTVVYTARLVQRTCAGLVPRLAQQVFELMQEAAFDWVGEFADEFSILKAAGHEDGELQQDLMLAIDKWADKHQLQPTFFGVEDVEKHQVDPVLSQEKSA